MPLLEVSLLSRRSAAVSAAAFCFLLTLSAQDIKVTGGVVEHQVFQRNAEGRADIKLAGTANIKFNAKYVEARVVKKDGSPVSGLDWNPFAERVKAGKWAGDVKGVPVGGPYKLEVRISGSPASAASIDDIAVGDLWVLAGQSNMQGVGDLVDVQQPLDAVHSFDMSDNWDAAREPLHRLRSSADRVHWAKNEKGEPERWTPQQEDEAYAKSKKGAGLGLPFAVELLRRTGVPIGLVPCAHGGTSMDQWSPELKDKGPDSLYGATIRRIQAVGGKVKGVLWYQGESDANDKVVDAFPAKFQALVAAFRSDTGIADLPFYYVQIGRHVNGSNVAAWNKIQEYQRQAEATLKNSGMVAAIDLGLDDQIHVGTQDLKRLGRRLAMLAAHDLFGDNKENAAVKRGPRPVSAKLNGDTITLKLAEVNGQLVSEGRISGFTVHDAKGAMVPMIYKSRFDPADPTVIHLSLVTKLPEGATLYYGAGKDPYCNVRDTSDMALPVFGPLKIQQ